MNVMTIVPFFVGALALVWVLNSLLKDMERDKS